MCSFEAMLNSSVCPIHPSLSVFRDFDSTFQPVCLFEAYFKTLFIPPPWCLFEILFEHPSPHLGKLISQLKPTERTVDCSKESLHKLSSL